MLSKFRRQLTFTALASVLVSSACATNESSNQTKQLLANVFPGKAEQRGILSIQQLASDSHALTFRSQAEPLQNYARKYSVYCIQNGRSVPVKVTNVALSKGTSPRVLSATLSCQ